MGLLDDYSGGSGLTGLGMAPRPSREHQFILSNLITNLNIILKNSNFIALSEDSAWKKGRNEKAPDVVIYEMTGAIEKWTPVVFIEIERFGGFKANIKESKELMQKLPSVKEAIIFDYNNESWYSIPDGPGVSYCKTFGVDIKNIFLKRL